MGWKDFSVCALIPGRILAVPPDREPSRLAAALSANGRAMQFGARFEWGRAASRDGSRSGAVRAPKLWWYQQDAPPIPIKAPSPNIQHPEKLQTPSSKKLRAANPFWRLRLDVSLELGCWGLELMNRLRSIIRSTGNNRILHA